MPATDAGRLCGRRAGREVEIVGGRLRSVRVVPAVIGGAPVGFGAGVFGGGNGSATGASCLSSDRDSPGVVEEFAAAAGWDVDVPLSDVAAVSSFVAVAVLAGSAAGASTSISSDSSIWSIGTGGFVKAGAGVLESKSGGAAIAVFDGVASTRFAAA